MFPKWKLKQTDGENRANDGKTVNVKGFCGCETNQLEPSNTLMFFWQSFLSKEEMLLFMESLVVRFVAK